MHSIQIVTKTGAFKFNKNGEHSIGTLNEFVDFFKNVQVQDVGRMICKYLRCKQIALVRKMVDYLESIWHKNENVQVQYICRKYEVSCKMQSYQ